MTDNFNNPNAMSHGGGQFGGQMGPQGNNQFNDQMGQTFNQFNGPNQAPMNGYMAGPHGGPMGAPSGGPMVSPNGAQMGGPMGAPNGGPMGGPNGAPMGGPNGSPNGAQMGGPQDLYNIPNGNGPINAANFKKIQPLRQISLDTETTGMLADDGTPGTHRVIEYGCVELINRKETGRVQHFFFDPEREIDKEAINVHGITLEVIRQNNGTLFKDRALEIKNFLEGAELLIHNAKFDVAFLNMEFERSGLKNEQGETLKLEDICKITDTIGVAKAKAPGHQVSLDKLCSVYEIDNSDREKHGALLDASLLAKVYIAMTTEQSGFDIANDSNDKAEEAWVRRKGVQFRRMAVEPKRHAVHVEQMITLAQSNSIGQNEAGEDMCGSFWSKEFDAPMLKKLEDEGKKEFQKRKAEQKDVLLQKLLTPEQLKELEEYHAEEIAAHEDFERRVLGIK